jgi:3-methyl-2-oxobutanoate hydroxymethyltransferase
MSRPGETRPVTVQTFARLKRKGGKIVAITAYDALFARLQDEAGVDCLLVGDSVGMVYGGRPDTLAVTMDQMIYHTACVSRVARRALVVMDMPFLAAQLGGDEALRNCGRALSEGGASAVKIEGAGPVLETVRRVVGCGIPVMGHLGLVPQSIHALGGWGLRGRDPEEAGRLLEDAHRLEEAGCFALVLERVEPELAARITASLGIPTIGIGSGAACDGQVLVNMDLLGLFEDFRPAFVRRFAELAGEVRSAVGDYARAVREGGFPAGDEI